MRTKRDRRLTPTSSSLAAGWDEAVSREITDVKPDTASDFYLKAKDIWIIRRKRNRKKFLNFYRKNCSDYIQQKSKDKFFSQVEIGKNWLLDRLRRIALVRIIKGYEANIRREQLKLPKEEDKTKRVITSHVTDCIAMGSIILGLGIEIKNKFKFNVISRPKYSRRILFAEQAEKGGIFERAGGHIPSDRIFKGLRKGDYVEARAPNLKKIYRGWISGYTGDRIFDWNQSPSFSADNIKLLDRNHGLINLRLSWIKDTIDIDRSYGTKQKGVLKMYGIEYNSDIEPIPEGLGLLTRIKEKQKGGIICG